MESAMKDEDGRCYTECDRYGCHCRLVSNQTDMEAVDHVVLSLLSTSGRRNSTDGNPAICLCGNVQVSLKGNNQTEGRRIISILAPVSRTFLFFFWQKSSHSSLVLPAGNE